MMIVIIAMIRMMMMILMTRLVAGVRSLRICNRSNITKPGRHFGGGEHGSDGDVGVVGGGGWCLVVNIVIKSNTTRPLREVDI